MSITSIEGVIADLGRDAAAVRLAAAAVVRKAAFDTQSTARQFCPVDTGALRNSISVDIAEGGLEAVVGPTMEYSPYVEYGTSRQAPRAFLGPAFDRHSGEFVDGMHAIRGVIV